MTDIMVINKASLKLLLALKKFLTVEMEVSVNKDKVWKTYIKVFNRL